MHVAPASASPMLSLLDMTSRMHMLSLLDMQPGTDMTFREKSYLVILLGNAAFALLYFGSVFAGQGAGGGAVGLFMAALVVQVAITVIGTAAIAALDPAGAHRPADERERLIELRATRVGYFVLISGTLAAAALVHFGFRAFALANAAFGAVLLAEIARYSAFLVLMRRPA